MVLYGIRAMGEVERLQHIQEFLAGIREFCGI
jgi:hypothetical protein